MYKPIIFLLPLLILSHSRIYPLIDCCAPQWANETIGTSNSTICTSGTALCSIVIALNSLNKDYNPSTLNTWLKQNKGYISGGTIVWSALKPLGLNYKGKFTNNRFEEQMDLDNVVIPRREGNHYAVASSYFGPRAYLNDPYNHYDSYQISSFDQNETVVYEVANMMSEVR